MQIEDKVGFSDTELATLVRRTPCLNDMVECVSLLGFHYIGDTQSESKAYTDVLKKHIFIGRNNSLHEACLSLAYEMTNALNLPKIRKVYEKYLKDSCPSLQRA